MKRFLLLPLLLLAACTATRLTSSWTAPQAGAVTYKKLLVVGLPQTADSALLAGMEAQLAADLRAIGYEAVAFHRRFNAAEMRYLRYDSVRRRLAAEGIEGVVTIGLMAKESQTFFVKEKGGIRPESAPMGSFWESPVTAVKQAPGKGGYAVTSTEYFWESRFYDVASVALLYASQTTAADVSSAHNLAHKYARLIVADMQKNYLLTAKRGY